MECIEVSRAPWRRSVNLPQHSRTTAVHTVLWSIKAITAARVGTRALRRCGRWSTAVALAAAVWVVARVPVLALAPRQVLYDSYPQMGARSAIKATLHQHHEY